MPKILSTTTGTFTEELHCTNIGINLPVNGDITLYAHLTRIVKDGDGKVISETPHGSVHISKAKIVALPAFADAYSQLRDLIHNEWVIQSAPPAANDPAAIQ